MTAEVSIGAGPLLRLEEGAAAVGRRLEAWREVGYTRRLWGHDPTLWAEAGTPEIENRLGWLDLPRTMTDPVEDLTALGREIRDAGVRELVLLGMGGSSLAPEVFYETFGSAPGFPRLRVLDTTHPAAVAGLAADLTLGETLFVVSSKSGTTLETLSLLRYFWALAGRESDHPGSHFVAITDPDSSLHRLGTERGFRRVLLAPADVGGRYSALTQFGLAPAALMGIDPQRLLATAGEMARACQPGPEGPESPGLELGAALGELALAGRDKLTLITTPGLSSFPDWIEQLVAESTGKNGRGIVPVVGEAERPVEAYATDRFFVGIGLAGDGLDALRRRLVALGNAGHPFALFEITDPGELGAEIFRWEVAVASAGSVLGIQPFDQPDVQLAKTMAREAMASSGSAASMDLPEAFSLADLDDALGSWLGSCRPGDYLSIQAFLAPGEALEGALRRIATLLGERTGLATTLGWGPRFLHSTGQLHKGGANNGCFLQLFDTATPELPVPESDFGFERLVAAQAVGDAMALESRRRRLLRVDLGDAPEAALAELIRRLGG